MNTLKTIPTLLLICISACVSGQYYDFPYIGWRQTFEISQGDYMGNFTKEFVESSVSSDTLINGNTFYKIEHKYGSQLVRSEMGKVYKFNPITEEEDLVIDFSLEIGDSFIYTRIILLAGIVTDTLIVYNKEKILGPGQDSVYRMQLAKDPIYPSEGLTWIEGAGDWIGGLISGDPSNKMTGIFLLCTLNEKGQSIYNTEIFECPCESIYGPDEDRDGARDHEGAFVSQDITWSNFGKNSIVKINACDTLVINNITDLSTLVIADGDIITPDSTFYSDFENLVFYNLGNYEVVEVTHQISEVHFTVWVFECTPEDCDDRNFDINPFVSEIPYNGIDEDCDPLTLDDDLDQDGFLLSEDCDDMNPDINPNAMEIPNNQIDEDCDGEDLITSSTQNFNNSSIKVYPNPAIHEVSIVVRDQIDCQVSLVNLLGHTVHEIRNVKSISVTAFPPGVYFLVIRNIESNQSINKRIVIGE